MKNSLESVNPSNLSVFEFHSQPVRLLTQNHEPWFIAKDVCKAVEVRNTSHALLRLDDDEKDKFVLNDSIGRKRNTVIVSESGMYALVLSSRKPCAKVFRRWVTSEVLPSIRKTGSYFQAQPENDPIALATDDDSDDGYYKQYRYDDLDAPIDLDEQFTKIDYVFDALPYDCREELTVRRQKVRVLQELIAAFPRERKFVISRDLAIALADAERYFTIDQLADRLERMVLEATHGDDVAGLLEKMDYIRATENTTDEVSPTNSARFFTRRVAGKILWRENILPLMFREYRWQQEHQGKGQSL